MHYSLHSRQKDPNILLELLQNRFTKFNDSIVKWKFRNKEIDSNFLEEKLVKNYKNKKNNYSKSNNDYHDWIDIFDNGLKEIKSTNKQPVIFFSGGKDSTFIASRLIQNNIDAIYISFITNDNEKKIIDELANKLKIKVFFTSEKLEFLNFEDILKNIKEPVMDPAGLSVLMILDTCIKNNIKFSDAVFIDGMGNDAYMGHVPSRRELQKRYIQKFINFTNLNKIIPTQLWNSMGKLGDILRPDYMYNFPGSNIKLENYTNLNLYYKKYSILKDIPLQRALQRGIHYDFCCAMNKSIIYVDAINETSKVIFPFLNENLIDHFEKRTMLDFNYSTLVNKLSLRKYLNRKLNFDKISKTKNIFKPTYLDFKFNKNQLQIASNFNIKINKLNIMQKSDFYLWSKYIINNNINFAC